jgi:hypothetical protein
MHTLRSVDVAADDVSTVPLADLDVYYNDDF